MTDAPMSFLTLFICFLVEVHRSSSKSHGLFFPFFIHRILLHLDLEDFPASELVHIIAPIGATFLRRRAAQMRASFTRPLAICHKKGEYFLIDRGSFDVFGDLDCI